VVATKPCTDVRCYCILTHEEYQQQIQDLATIGGWTFLHVRRTKGKNGWCTSTNVEGWPDLFLWHPRHGFAAIEVKSAGDPRNKAGDERRALQRAVLDSLAAAGAKTIMAWPHQFDEVQAVLLPVPAPPR
jgi:transposase